VDSNEKVQCCFLITDKVWWGTCVLDCTDDRHWICITAAAETNAEFVWDVYSEDIEDY